jgi:hypothetical protein
VTDKKTPEADFKRFESFIDGMEDIEYEYWIANEATEKQRKFALELREEVDEDEVFGYSGETFFGLQGYRSRE